MDFNLIIHFQNWSLQLKVWKLHDDLPKFGAISEHNGAKASTIPVIKDMSKDNP